MATPPNEQRPGRAAEALRNSTGESPSSVPSLCLSTDEIAARRRWAYGLIRKAKTPPPRYGSAEWNALPLDNPARVAASVIAAESWATDADELPERLAIEIDCLRANHKKLEDAEYVEKARAHRAANRVPTRPTFVERRRAQLESVEPRASDFQGKRTGA